jgi:hypothetical protein
VRPADACLLLLTATLRDAGFFDFADALDRAETDRSRALTLTRHGDEIEILGRTGWLRKASASLWAAFDALDRATKETERATKETERAAAAIDAYSQRKDPR